MSIQSISTGLAQVAAQDVPASRPDAAPPGGARPGAPPSLVSPMTGKAATEGKSPTQPGSDLAAATQQLEEAAKKIEQSVQMNTQSLQFSVDDDTGRTIVSVVDKESGKLIRQIPSEELIELAKSLDRQQGKLLQNQA